MKDHIQEFSPAMLASLMRAFPARAPMRDLRKPEPITVEAYLLPQHMHHNRAEIQSGELCGCISCEQMLQRDEIRLWVAAGTTAVCPRCDSAAVVGSGAGFQLTPELLHRAHSLLFEGNGKTRLEAKASQKGAVLFVPSRDVR